MWLICAAPSVVHAQDQPQDKPIGEAPEERNAEDIFLRNQRVLLGRGEVVLDIGQFYSRADTLQLAVVTNSVQLATYEQSALTTTLVGRVGIFHETELFAGTSFNHLENRLVAGVDDLASTGRNLFGGVIVGIRRTLLREGAGRPDIIASFDGQIPTDDDLAYVLGGGLVFVKSIDPVVLFAGTNYHRGLARTLPDGTHQAPGNLFDVSLGYGLSLNDSLAISTAAAGSFTRNATVVGINVRRAEIFSIRFAVTSSVAKGLYIEPSVTIGLSGPGQSFTMGVTVPYSF
jgi:hypothetical protein